MIDYLPINDDRFQKQNTLPRKFTNSEFKRSTQRRKRSLTRKFTRSVPPNNRYGPASEEAPPYHRAYDAPQRKQNNID